MSDLKDRRAGWSVALFAETPGIKAEFVLAASERRGRTNRRDSAPAATIAGEVLSVKAVVR